MNKMMMMTRFGHDSTIPRRRRRRTRSRTENASILLTRIGRLLLVLVTIITTRIKSGEALQHQQQHQQEASSQIYRNGGCLADLTRQLRPCNSDDDHGDMSGICQTQNDQTPTIFGNTKRNNRIHYKEVRLLGGNWESRVLSTWVLQILLSELLGVPTTVENGLLSSPLMMTNHDDENQNGNGGSALLNFYAKEDVDLFSTTYNQYNNNNDDTDDTMMILGHARAKHLALAAAYEANGDCEAVTRRHQHENKNNNHNYRPCAHFAVENWDAEHPLALQALREHKLERTFSGLTGQQGSWYVTQHTVQTDPSLATYYGLAGNRAKLAATFLQPLSWGQYCERISPNNCTTPNEIAARAPQTRYEANRYHVVEDSDNSDVSSLSNVLYQGHFAATEQNNCTLHPNTCTGHIADFNTCEAEWPSHVAAQTHYNDIALTPQGYSYAQLRELWRAAAATGHHLIMPWWTPHQDLYQQFLNHDNHHPTPHDNNTTAANATNATLSKTIRMHRVTLPPRTEACVRAQNSAPPVTCRRGAPPHEKHDNPHGEQNRHDVFAPTNGVLEERTVKGSPDTACDGAPQPLFNLMEGSFRHRDQHLPEALQSPAYQAMTNFQLSSRQVNEILQYYNSDHYRGRPREAVCVWARDNLQVLQRLVPTSYPRAMDNDTYDAEILSYALATFGMLTGLAIAATIVMVYQNRKKHSVKTAQIEFLWLFLTGLIFIVTGAVILALPLRSSWMCVAHVWLTTTGVTLQWVPLVIKTAAFHRIIAAAQNLRRVVLPREKLLGGVAFILSIVIAFLASWTALDPPRRVPKYLVESHRTNEDGDTIVSTCFDCNSRTDAWQITALSWNGFLVLCAVVVVVQSGAKLRFTSTNLSETETLSRLAYVHIIFLLFLTMVSLVLVPGENVTEAVGRKLQGLLLILDALLALIIYFLPKLNSVYQQAILENQIRKADEESGISISAHMSMHVSTNTRNIMAAGRASMIKHNTSSRQFMATLSQDHEEIIATHSGHNEEKQIDRTGPSLGRIVSSNSGDDGDEECTSFAEAEDDDLPTEAFVNDLVNSSDDFSKTEE